MNWAKKTGRLRKDFTAEDPPPILMSDAGVLTATGDFGPDALRRLVHVVCAASTPARAPLPAAIPPEQMQCGYDPQPWPHIDPRVGERDLGPQRTK